MNGLNEIIEEWECDACPECGNNNVEAFSKVRGFPGEHFVVCDICQSVVETEFNIWEVI